MTRTCKSCGRELELTEFRICRGGVRTHTCNSCIKEKRAQSRYNRSQLKYSHVNMGGTYTEISDPDFDGKTIGDVWRQMCRAQKWLESRGCVITLDGEFREVKVRKLKKE